MKKSIGRTFPQIDVVANTSVRIHEDFFNSHRDYHQLSQFEIAGSIKGDVNKKASPSADSREVFCLDIQPTVCRYASRSLERFGSGLLFRSLGFIFTW
jgi:hypothetical protein